MTFWFLQHFGPFLTKFSAFFDYFRLFSSVRKTFLSLFNQIQKFDLRSQPISLNKLTWKCKRSRSKFQLISFFILIWLLKCDFVTEPRFPVWKNYHNVTNVEILTEISSRIKFLSYKVWMIFRIGFGFDKFNLESVWHFQFIPTVTRKFQS